MADGPAWPVMTSSATPNVCRSVIGLTGQYAAVDELLTGRENLELVGLLYHLPKVSTGGEPRKFWTNSPWRRRGIGSSRRTPAGCEGGSIWSESHRGPAGPVPGRADDRPGPAHPKRPVAFIDTCRRRNDGAVDQQYMEEAERLANAIVVIDTGMVIAEGTADQLKDRMGAMYLKCRSPTRPIWRGPRL